VRRRVPPVALGFLLALVALRPILLDHCLLACSGASATSTPSCHHTGQQLNTRIETPGQPCGHDHGAVVLAANASVSHEPVSTMCVELVTAIDATLARFRSRLTPDSPPPSGTGSPGSFSLPLRL
jgi:hypothetical protein